MAVIRDDQRGRLIKTRPRSVSADPAKNPRAQGPVFGPKQQRHAAVVAAVPHADTGFRAVSLPKPTGDPRVRAVQLKLNAAGYKVDVDGRMGPQTRGAIGRYNRRPPLLDRRGTWPSARFRSVRTGMSRLRTWR